MCELVICGEKDFGESIVVVEPSYGKFDRTVVACLGSSFVEVLGCRILRFSAGRQGSSSTSRVLWR